MWYSACMANKKGEQISLQLSDKRREFIYSLISQRYTYKDIASIFNISVSRAHAIGAKCPPNYKSPWVKRGRV